VFQLRRAVVPLLAGLVTILASLATVVPALARSSQAGDPDTAHRVDPNRVIVNVDRGTHQVHVHGVADTANAAVQADTVTGGGGLGSAPTTKTTKQKTRTTQHATAKAADPTAANSTVMAPVVQDGGSQHLGERTLKQGMRGHDVRVLQGYLTVAGYPTSIDGDFGPGTKANVIKFENSHQLPPNGVVTYVQSRALRQVVATALAGGAVAKATINSDGTATAPAGAPPAVQAMIAAANQIVDKPYIYAGGHGRWNDNGYDCSGAVSFALHGAGMLSSPEDSTELESYGAAGPGKWVTIYANSNHTWIVIAGIAFDTAHYGPTTPGGSGPRWLTNATGNLADGQNYVVRHPSAL
jgi:peptidoglycan hydrolase-like protein with peptidoglycan-binding domain